MTTPTPPLPAGQFVTVAPAKKVYTAQYRYPHGKEADAWEPVQIRARLKNLPQLKLKPKLLVKDADPQYPAINNGLLAVDIAEVVDGQYARVVLSVHISRPQEVLPLLERKSRFNLKLVVFPEAPGLEQAVGAAGMLPPGVGAALPELAALETEGVCTVEIQPPTHWTVVVGKPGWSDEPVRIVPESPDLEWQTDSDIATLAADGGSLTLAPAGRFQSSRDGIDTRVDSEAVIRDAACTLWRGRKKVDGTWDERRQAYVFPIAPQPGGSGRPPLHLAAKARVGPGRLYQQSFERVIEKADSAERALQAAFGVDADLLEGREDLIDRGLAVLAESDARSIGPGFWLETKLQQIAFLLGFADTAGRSFVGALDLHRQARERLANSLTELFMELIFNFLDLLKAYKAGGKEGTEEAAKAKLKDVAKETGETIQKKLAARKGVLESVRDHFRAVLEAHQSLIDSLQRAARQVRQQVAELAVQIEKGSPRLQELRKQALRLSDGCRTFIYDTDKLLKCPPGQRAQLIEAIRKTIPAENAFLQGLLGRLAGAKKNVEAALNEVEDAVRRHIKELDDDLARVAEQEQRALLRQSEALGQLLTDQEAAAAAVRKNLAPTERAVQELDAGVQNADTWMRRSRELLRNPEAVTPEGVKSALEEISRNALPDSAAVRQSLDAVVASQADSVAQLDACLRALRELPEGALPAETGAALAAFLESRRAALRRHLSEPAEEFLSDRVTDAAKTSPDQLRAAAEDARAIEYKGYPMEYYAGQPAGTLWYLLDNAVPLAEYYFKTAAQWLASTWLGTVTLNFFVRLIVTMARAVAKYMTFLERVYSAARITSILPGAHRRRGIDAAGLPDDLVLSRDRDAAGLFGLIGDGISADVKAILQGFQQRIQADSNAQKTGVGQLFRRHSAEAMDPENLRPERLGARPLDPGRVTPFMEAILRPMDGYRKAFTDSETPDSWCKLGDYVARLGRTASNAAGEGATWEDVEAAIDWLGWSLVWGMRGGALILGFTPAAPAAVPGLLVAAQGADLLVPFLKSLVSLGYVLPEVLGFKFDIVIVEALLYDAVVNGADFPAAPVPRYPVAES